MTNVPSDVEHNRLLVLAGSNYAKTAIEDVIQDVMSSEATSAQNLLMPDWAYSLAAAYLSVISLMGLVLNGGIILIILRDQQPRAPLNWMLLNLAFSDSIIAVFGAPVSVAAALYGGWHLSHEFCVTYAMAMSYAGIASITTLTMLAFWRCTLVVCCSSNSRLHRCLTLTTGPNGQLGFGQAILVSAIIVGYSFAVTCPPLVGWGHYDLEAAHISCSVNWESRKDNNLTYIMYMFVFGLIVPLIIILVSYLSILCVVRKTTAMKHKMTGRHQMAQQDNSEAAEKRVTMMVVYMVGAYLIAWTPYAIFALLETFAPSSPEMSFVSPAVATLPSLFAKTSVVFNPLVYGLLNTQFRSTWSKFPVKSFMTKKAIRRDHHQTDLNRPKAHHKPSPTILMEMNDIAEYNNYKGSFNNNFHTAERTIEIIVAMDDPLMGGSTGSTATNSSQHTQSALVEDRMTFKSSIV